MLRISKEQMRLLQNNHLLGIKSDIASALKTGYPQAADLGEDRLSEFVRQSMEAARTVWIDDASQVRRFVKCLFVLEYVMKDETKVKAFAKVMISEQTAEARLLFVETNLL